MSCNASACEASSSAVLESSSAPAAFRCVTRPTWPMARLIWLTPAACSPEVVAATSCTRSAVFWIAGTSSLSKPPERSAIWTFDAANPPISWAAVRQRSARLRTSPATTAKPRPCSPAQIARGTHGDAQRADRGPNNYCGLHDIGKELLCGCRPAVATTKMSNPRGARVAARASRENLLEGRKSDLKNISVVKRSLWIACRLHNAPVAALRRNKYMGAVARFVLAAEWPARGNSLR
jgi:hypothetical protein